MCVFALNEAHELTQQEMRDVLRTMNDSTRNQVIFWLGKVGQSNDDGWTKLVIPFIKKVWPRERALRTKFSSSSWVGILDGAKDNFSAVYSAMKTFLVQITDDNSQPFYRFTRETNESAPITNRYPEDTLDFMNTVTPHSLTRPSTICLKSLN
jgi:hypothetical protein